MQNIIVGRYDSAGASSHGYAGWLEPSDKAWIAFIDTEGKPTFFLDRDPETGGVIERAPSPNVRPST